MGSWVETYLEKYTCLNLTLKSEILKYQPRDKLSEETERHFWNEGLRKLGGGLKI